MKEREREKNSQSGLGTIFVRDCYWDDLNRILGYYNVL